MGTPTAGECIIAFCEIMKSRVLITLGLGVLLTVVLTISAKVAYEAGAELLARSLLWPNTLLQSLIPCFNIGTQEKPFCEGTPLHLLVFGASEALSVVAYASIAYILIRRHN